MQANAQKQQAFDEACALIKSDGLHGFKLDIEADSTIAPDEDAERMAEAGVHAVLVSDEGKDDDDDHTKTDWVLVSRDPKALAAPEIEAVGAVPAEDRAAWRTWTDDFSNLYSIVRWK